MPGFIGKKIGMTRIFDEAGVQIPVTVIEAGPVSFDISPLPSGIYFVRAGASDVRTVVIRR